MKTLNCATCGHDFPATEEYWYPQRNTRRHWRYSCKRCLRAAGRVDRIVNRAAKKGVALVKSDVARASAERQHELERRIVAEFRAEIGLPPSNKQR